MEVCAIQNDDSDSSQIRNVGGDPCETQDQQDEKQRDEDRYLIPNTLDQSHGPVLELLVPLKKVIYKQLLLNPVRSNQN